MLNIIINKKKTLRFPCYRIRPILKVLFIYVKCVKSLFILLYDNFVCSHVVAVLCLYNAQHAQSIETP